MTDLAFHSRPRPRPRVLWAKLVADFVGKARTSPTTPLPQKVPDAPR